MGPVSRSRLLFVAGVFLILAPGASSEAQTPEMEVGEDLLVAQEPAGTVLIEPALATHPRDPDHLLAVGWVFPEGQNGQGAGAVQHCAVLLSQDGGRTWARHDFSGGSCADPWVSLTDERAVLTVLGTHPGLPDSSANREGIVAVAWMDRRDAPTDGCYAPYIVASADGGETFGAPVRVANEVSCPDRDRLGYPARRWPTGGDYFGFAGAPDGRFHVVWSDARSGTFAVRTAAVSVRVPGRD